MLLHLLVNIVEHFVYLFDLYQLNEDLIWGAVWNHFKLRIKDELDGSFARLQAEIDNVFDLIQRLIQPESLVVFLELALF